MHPYRGRGRGHHKSGELPRFCQVDTIWCEECNRFCAGKGASGVRSCVRRAFGSVCFLRLDLLRSCGLLGSQGRLFMQKKTQRGAPVAGGAATAGKGDTEGMTEKQNWAVEQLQMRHGQLGRLPKKEDFDPVTLSRIKAFLGPWPRALEAAGLKPPRTAAGKRPAVKRKKRRAEP